MTIEDPRLIRAAYTDDTITVYQAYAPRIAEPAVRAGRFTAAFSRDRMTWIKPSFGWMMYRSGWGRKPGQECVLAIEITRGGWEWALGHSCLSHYAPQAPWSAAAPCRTRSGRRWMRSPGHGRPETETRSAPRWPRR